MYVVVRLTKLEELKAIPILLRHSSGTVLPNGTYVISPGAAEALREAGVQFQEVSRLKDKPNSEVLSGERI